MATALIQTIRWEGDGTLVLTSASGLSGRAWAPRGAGAALPIVGRDATALEAIRGLCPAGVWPAVELACLDLAAQTAKAPLHQFLGGPTRHKVRVLTPLAGADDAALEASLRRAVERGARAFAVGTPTATPARALVSATVQRLERLRRAGGDNVDFVLNGQAALSPGEAGRIARALEGFHLLWFDEPCLSANLDGLKKISAETVTPLGFGRFIDTAGVFQELLREQVIDVVRPDLSVFGVTDTRRIAALAEAYYVAVAPQLVSRAPAVRGALGLAASLPNFFIQELELEQTPKIVQGYVEVPA